MELRQLDPWPDLFDACQRSAFHLEVRDTYAVPNESEPLRRFLNGEPSILESDPSWKEWFDRMVALSQRGVSVSRVRVVTVPHSDYQRWLLSVTADNVEAGEDIRYLPRNLAGEIPADDWWLFDDQVVAFNLVDQEGKPAGAAVTTDSNIAEYCVSVRDRLWYLATPYAEYLQ